MRTSKTYHSRTAATSSAWYAATCAMSRRSSARVAPTSASCVRARPARRWACSLRAASSCGPRARTASWSLRTAARSRWRSSMACVAVTRLSSCFWTRRVWRCFAEDSSCAACCSRWFVSCRCRWAFSASSRTSSSVPSACLVRATSRTSSSARRIALVTSSFAASKPCVAAAWVWKLRSAVLAVSRSRSSPAATSAISRRMRSGDCTIRPLSRTLSCWTVWTARAVDEMASMMPVNSSLSLWIVALSPSCVLWWSWISAIRACTSLCSASTAGCSRARSALRAARRCCRSALSYSARCLASLSWSVSVTRRWYFATWSSRNLAKLMSALSARLVRLGSGRMMSRRAKLCTPHVDMSRVRAERKMRWESDSSCSS
eukprot:m.173713 g.173713  ORF g.173713 m.173713 type:complete len:375 (+) comp15311_c0_seq1:55-1179(+)